MVKGFSGQKCIKRFNEDIGNSYKDFKKYKSSSFIMTWKRKCVVKSTLKYYHNPHGNTYAILTNNLIMMLMILVSVLLKWAYKMYGISKSSINMSRASRQISTLRCRHRSVTEVRLYYLGDVTRNSWYYK